MDEMQLRLLNWLWMCPGNEQHALAV